MQVDENSIKIEYIPYAQLDKPQPSTVSIEAIELGFASKSWVVEFETLTALRKANRYHQKTCLQQLLPKFYQSVISQVDNLRSNNSKQALVLLVQFFTDQDISLCQSELIRPMVASLFSKATSEKNFLKEEAMRGINVLPQKQNPFILDELVQQTQSHNSTISELAIKVTHDFLEKHKYAQIDEKFFKFLAYSLSGKRAFVQRKAREILEGISLAKGKQATVGMIDGAKSLTEEESTILKKELGKSTSKESKGPSFKDYIKMKKAESAN